MNDNHDDDDRIDALVRAASQRTTDEALLANNVLRRIRQDRQGPAGKRAGLLALPSFAGPGRFAPAGFALVLLATPFAVARYPVDQTEAVVTALALGDLALIGPTDGAIFGRGAFE